MVQLILNTIATLGRVGLQVMYNMDDPSIDKQMIKNAITITDAINSIKLPDLGSASNTSNPPQFPGKDPVEFYKVLN